MKKTENKITSIQNGEGFLTYSDLLKAVLNVTPQGGYTFEDIEIRLKIKKILEENNETIELEDSDYKYLQPLLNSMKWGIMSESIPELKKDFNNAEK